MMGAGSVVILHMHTHALTHSTQVKHRHTGQVMVMKEMRHYSDEAKVSFLKEVSK